MKKLFCYTSRGFLVLLFAPIIGSQVLHEHSIASELNNQACNEYVWMGATANGFCKYSKDIYTQCKSLSDDSIYKQCNIFALDLDRLRERRDDNGQKYLSAIFKFSETNSCGSNDISVWKCDSFAAYAQVMRNLSSNKCYAFVNSGLIGIKPAVQGNRNDLIKPIRIVTIPGISRRILFTPSDGQDFIAQPSSILLQTSDLQRLALKAGPAISFLSILELQSSLTIKPENLKRNPSLIRIVRGDGSGSDYLDIRLGKKAENSLIEILKLCK